MRKSLGFGSTTLLVGAAVVLVAQPTWAASTQVTNIRIQPTGGGVNVALETKSGNRPQIFTVSRGKTWMADIINTQLRLPSGNSFRQDNPAPGISSVVVIPLSQNTVRVVVTGQNGSPTGVAARRGSGGLLISLNRAQADQGAAQAPAVNPEGTIAQTPVAQAPNPSSQRPNVLVPDPKVIIDGVPATPPQQANVAPAFLRRAAAPPVGDIAISNIDASANAIDLGSAERVPRLVLRDAPAREVLALLARAAGLNLAFTTDAGGQQPAAQPGATATGPTISLDIENESVQDVFNYVLRLSNLQANRVGRTVFVGARLPNAAQDVVIRSFRLNQVAAEQASGFLVSMGAESAITQTQPVTTVTAVAVPGSTTPITQTNTTNQTVVNTLRINPTDAVPLLRGLQVLVDTRTNSLTLVGPRRLVEVASSQLLQLDLRRRQVAVNVKIIDVNLSGTDSFRGSIGFGINDTYVTSDGGATSINFGTFRPPTATEASGLNSVPIITNPITGTPSLNPNDPVNFGGSLFPRPGGPLSQSGDPTQPIITNFTPETRTTTFDANNNQIITSTPATLTAALPTLFQFPTRLLVSLQAQVVAGNAKILTDPTLVVQEGQAASVNLTQDVVANITTTTSTSTPPVITQTANIQPAGLSLSVNVERIDDNGFVTMSVAPRVTAISGTQAFGGNTIALLATRSLSSGTIRLRDGQTLILSGIIQEQERTQISKIPILGDLPLIGALFRSTQRSDQRAEVIVLLTPQILDDSDQSVMGYSYTPGPEARQILRRGGSNTQGQ